MDELGFAATGRRVFYIMDTSHKAEKIRPESLSLS